MCIESCQLTCHGSLYIEVNCSIFKLKSESICNFRLCIGAIDMILCMMKNAILKTSLSVNSDSFKDMKTTSALKLEDCYNIHNIDCTVYHLNKQII